MLGQLLTALRSRAASGALSVVAAVALGGATVAHADVPHTAQTGAHGVPGRLHVVAHAAAVTGYQLIEQDFGPFTDSFAWVGVECPAGDHVLGGGGRVIATGSGNGDPAVDSMAIHASWPVAGSQSVDGNDGWSVQAVQTQQPANPSTAQYDVQVWAICGT